ncbi:DUF5822 domain-containing protein [Halovenus carboxidivorans]|uniref:DUF5822 domain-containing protein n=1 Tax=Halovenus carboxidivorans TaxID=2692199 RepID=UPI001915A1FA
MTPEVRTSDPDGIDYGWIMQVTFIATLFVGTPVVTVLSVFAELPTWPDRAMFAVRVGALIWFVTLLVVYLYARLYRDPGDRESGSQPEDREAVSEGQREEPERDVQPSPQSGDDD